MTDDEIIAAHTAVAILDAARSIPGVEVKTGVRCRAIRPAPGSTPNMYLEECKGMLINHAGPHSWGSAVYFPREWQ